MSEPRTITAEISGQIVDFDTYTEMIQYMGKHKVGNARIVALYGEKTVLVGVPRERPVVDLSNSPVREETETSEKPRSVRRGR